MTNEKAYDKTQKDLFSLQRAITNQKISSSSIYADHQNKKRFFDYIHGNTIERIKDLNKDFQNILILSFSEESNHKMQSRITTIYNRASITTALPRDLEGISNHEEGKKFDLIISIMNLHKINAPEVFLYNIYNLLASDGFFIESFLGGESLQQFRDYMIRKELELTKKASQRVHPMIKINSIASLMQESPFKFPIVDHELITIKCDSFKKLYQNIKSIGETSCLNATDLIHRSTIQGIYRDCKASQFPPEHHLDIIFVSGWKIK